MPNEPMKPSIILDGEDTWKLIALLTKDPQAVVPEGQQTAAFLSIVRSIRPEYIESVMRILREHLARCAKLEQENYIKQMKSIGADPFTGELLDAK